MLHRDLAILRLHLMILLLLGSLFGSTDCAGLDVDRKKLQVDDPGGMDEEGAANGGPGADHVHIIRLTLCPAHAPPRFRLL